jgi:hypothetical protein
LCRNHFPAIRSRPDDLAQAIVDLINSRPRTPTRVEIAAGMSINLTTAVLGG